MEVVHFDEAPAFLEAAGSELGKDVARHQLILGIAETVAGQSDVYPSYHAWVVSEGSQVLAAASCTPPYNYVLADSADPGLTRLLVRTLAKSEVAAPGVIGNVPTIDDFVEGWKAETGSGARRLMGQGMFSLERVETLELAEGEMRPALAADRDLVTGWWRAFLEEANPDEPISAAFVEERIAQRLDPQRPQGISLWVSGKAVLSMSAYSTVVNSMRIGPVYTPPDTRGNGYATALVATQSAQFLQQGRDSCLLYTDLANPTSNAIYRRIGYRQVGESTVYRFIEKLA